MLALKVFVGLGYLAYLLLVFCLIKQHRKLLYPFWLKVSLILILILLALPLGYLSFFIFLFGYNS
ncbi:hypothetical protein [Streptococcus loxodontisalivarius]|uniref:Glucan phosphoethanolaminetransferase (Alkaline phosphatase superfamily) n=1 Tax=Streptococcus loxodontisalivarius TaxID=1349415 RepID=A0ABS2PSH0_9STRE|nr:hypothetical protein [Streptococcus loxodontisalivarius]MBM7642495.1 glucan phosphoethanolaminetransferase (alkaline phosphatase superfamily) [Streptococcus loxodontisalivarius]